MANKIMQVEQTQVDQKTADQEKEDRLRLMKRAQAGDKATRREVAHLLSQMGPEGLRPLKEMARDLLLGQMCGDNVLLEEDVKHQMREKERQLVGEAPTPLERLLGERIVLCWLHLCYYETLHAQSLSDLSLRQAQYQQQRIDGAHRRYLSAIKALAQVRRLQLPAVQVNIGEKQVNIMVADTVASTKDNLPRSRAIEHWDATGGNSPEQCPEAA